MKLYSMILLSDAWVYIVCLFVCLSVCLLTFFHFHYFSVVDFNFTFNPEIGALNSTVEITRSDVAQISDETNYT